MIFFSYFSNNLVGRILDELTNPLRKLNLDEAELVAMKAIIAIDPEAKGLSPGAVCSLSQLRDRIQHALFQLISEKERSLHAATARFGNLLLMLPALAKLSSVISENVQFAKMFGCEIVDPFLVEIFVDYYTETIPAAGREKANASTQTNGGCINGAHTSSPLSLANINTNATGGGGLISPPIYSPYLAYPPTHQNYHFSQSTPPTPLSTTYSSICFSSPNYASPTTSAFFDTDVTVNGNFRLL